MTPAAAGQRAAFAVIRRNRPYQVFLTVTLLSFAGSTLHVVAAAWLILRLTGADYAVPLLLLFSVLPGVVLTPVVGSIVDRFDPRAVLVIVDGVSALAVMLIPVMAWTGHLHAWHLYAVETVAGICGQFYGPASRIFVWRLASPEELLAANATVTLVYQLGIAFGALVGGVLVATAGPVPAIVINAASFAISAAGMAAVGRTRTGPRTAGGSGRRGMGDIAVLTVRQPRIRYMTLLYLALQSIYRLLSGLLVPFVAAAGFGPGIQGTLQMTYSLGGVLAGGLIPPLARRYGERLLLLLGSVGVAAIMAAFSVTGVAWLALILYGALGLAVGSWVYYLTAAQQLVPGPQQGSYFALVGSLVSLSGVAVYAVSSAALRFVQPHTMYWLGAAALLAVSLPSVALVRGPAPDPGEPEPGELEPEEAEQNDAQPA